MAQQVLVASPDAELRRRIVPALARCGFVVDGAATNLELVWRVTTRPPHALVLDARRASGGRGFGAGPLRWLREDARHSSVVVVADHSDAAAIAEAELAEAACVVAGMRAHPGAVVRAVKRVLRCRRPRELLRWIPPRTLPRITLAPRAGDDDDDTPPRAPS